MDSGTPTVSGPRRRRSRFTCRRLDKLCCLVAGYFPLFFVYGVTSWALYTEAYSIGYRTLGGFQGLFWGGLGVLFYVLLMWSYTHAVFTSPGTPMDNKHAYSHLPTTESISTSSVTVKSDGQERFCKKCQCRKPDRTHHCSSCRTCVLKMDHHCPWLANCLGLRNYKAFLLFLIYTSLFCMVCFAASLKLVYQELFANGPPADGQPNPIDDLAPINWVLLLVISGIIGLVITGFTIWHLMLTGSNTTTIESLEKVRYTAPSLRNGAPPPGARLLDDYSTPHHEANRYGAYLLEESSKKLPHAFNLGRRRNFAQVFGGKEKWLLWFFPVFSGVGDGWNWETSKSWQDAAIALRAEREKWLREQGERERAAGWGYDPAEEQAWNRGNPDGLVKFAGSAPPQPQPQPQPQHKRARSKADKLLGRTPGAYTDSEGVPLRKMKRPPSMHAVETDSDEESDDDVQLKLKPVRWGRGKKPHPHPHPNNDDAEWGTWN